MIRIFLAMGVGAALMYIFDPRQGQERRAMLSERMHQGKEQAQHAVESGKSVVEQAKETAAEARERLDARLHRTSDTAEEYSSAPNS